MTISKTLEEMGKTRCTKFARWEPNMKVIYFSATSTQQTMQSHNNDFTQHTKLQQHLYTKWAVNWFWITSAKTYQQYSLCFVLHWLLLHLHLKSIFLILLQNICFICFISDCIHIKLVFLYLHKIKNYTYKPHKKINKYPNWFISHVRYNRHNLERFFSCYNLYS